MTRLLGGARHTPWIQSKTLRSEDAFCGVHTFKYRQSSSPVTSLVDSSGDEKSDGGISDAG